MNFQIYFLLSAMMFLEYGIWGAWSPVLAARLLGPLKMSGKQTGWIYGTFFLACIVSPLIAGQIADQWLATERFLAAAQLIGGVLMLWASRKKTFSSLFVVMALYSLCYAGTLPLVNSLMFSQLGKALTGAAAIDEASAKIFLWAPIAWVLSGLLLTGWRRAKGTGDGSDCLILAGILSLIMGLFSFLLPHTPPSHSSEVAILQAFAMLKDTDVLIFMLLSFVVTTQLQFYYLGTAQFLQDIGVQSRNVPAVMTIAQIAQTIATLFALGYFLKAGYKWTLTAGVLSWLIMYLIYSLRRPRQLVIASMAFHGIAYVLFIIAGQIFINAKAPQAIKASAQALIFTVTIGIGLFVGTQITGVIMDHFRKEGKFQWRPIFLVPCALIAVCAAAFVLFFKGLVQ